MSEIFKRSIVEVVNKNSGWASYQGLVIDPQFAIRNGELRVAVFFFPEVESFNFRFHRRGVMLIDEWDENYSDQCRNGYVDFLFINDDWKRCPRVVFFRPEELVVQYEWHIKKLARRLFLETHRSVCGFSDFLPKNPSLHMCHLRDCGAQATKIALFCVSGSVYPAYVCDICFSEINGMRMGDFPACKIPLLSFDGKPMLAPKET